MDKKAAIKTAANKSINRGHYRTLLLLLQILPMIESYHNTIYFFKKSLTIETSCATILSFKYFWYFNEENIYEKKVFNKNLIGMLFDYSYI